MCCVSFMLSPRTPWEKASVDITHPSFTPPIFTSADDNHNHAAPTALSPHPHFSSLLLLSLPLSSCSPSSSSSSLCQAQSIVYPLPILRGVDCFIYDPSRPAREFSFPSLRPLLSTPTLGIVAQLMVTLNVLRLSSSLTPLSPLLIPHSPK